MAALELVLNGTTEGEQDTPAIASDNVGFVAVFEDESGAPPDRSDTRVLARLIGQCGVPVFEDFVVDSLSGVKQESPSVASRSPGPAGTPRTFFIAWTVGSEVRGRLLIDDQFPNGAFIVETSTAEVDEPYVAAGPDGIFLVAWHETLSAGTSSIRGRLYTSLGDPMTDVFSISAGPRDTNPVAVYSIDGSLRFMVVWSKGGDTIEGGFVKFDGTLDGTFTVSTRTAMQTVPALARGERKTMAV
jgi:hypothetical protein